MGDFHIGSNAIVGGLIAVAGYFGRRWLDNWTAHEDTQNQKLDDHESRICTLEGELKRI